jgi:hypothetical protein
LGSDPNGRFIAEEQGEGSGWKRGDKKRKGVSG